MEHLIEFKIETGETVTHTEVLESFRAFMRIHRFPYGDPRSMRFTPLRTQSLLHKLSSRMKPREVSD